MSAPVKMTKTTKVLHFTSMVNEEVVFARPEDETRLTITFEDWHLMGNPEQVTVSIVPGDTLNG